MSASVDEHERDARGAPGLELSAERTAFFTGSTYVPRFVSGKIDVRHVVAPIVTSTRTDPNPVARWPARSSISSASASGRLRKYQAAGPSCSHTSASNLNVGGIRRTLLA